MGIMVYFLLSTDYLRHDSKCLGLHEYFTLHARSRWDTSNAMQCCYYIMLQTRTIFLVQYISVKRRIQTTMLELKVQSLLLKFRTCEHTVSALISQTGFGGS